MCGAGRWGGPQVWHRCTGGGRPGRARSRRRRPVDRHRASDVTTGPRRAAARAPINIARRRRRRRHRRRQVRAQELLPQTMTPRQPACVEAAAADVVDTAAGRDEWSGRAHGDTHRAVDSDVRTGARRRRPLSATRPLGESALVATGDDWKRPACADYRSVDVDHFQNLVDISRCTQHDVGR